jgi:hypothetical protein
VNRRGIIYDTGIVFVGRGYKVPTRPKLDLGTARRELQIIRDDLHCNAVRIVGDNPERVAAVAADALDLGLEVWLSAGVFNGLPEAAMRSFAATAELAERLSRAHPGRVVLIVGSELTLFVEGIVPGSDVAQRAAAAFSRIKAGDHRANDRLNDFLAQAVQTVRAVYHGPITYASLMLEDVDWGRFDFIGVDHYRDARIKDRYVDVLGPLLAQGKPVVVTEFGMRTYRGADSGGGAIGFGIHDNMRVFLHQLPVVGRLFRDRLNGDYVRDEPMQARELAETLALLDEAGVDGAFIQEFVTARDTTSDNPRYDLDMNAFGLVKAYRHGNGTTYPDMTWEPKQSFAAVADFYASHQDTPGSGPIPPSPAGTT